MPTTTYVCGGTKWYEEKVVVLWLQKTRLPHDKNTPEGIHVKESSSSPVELRNRLYSLTKKMHQSSTDWESDLCAHYGIKGSSIFLVLCVVNYIHNVSQRVWPPINHVRLKLSLEAAVNISLMCHRHLSHLHFKR